jgi:hypothetical protein
MGFFVQHLHTAFGITEASRTSSLNLIEITCNISETPGYLANFPNLTRQCFNPMFQLSRREPTDAAASKGMTTQHKPQNRLFLDGSIGWQQYSILFRSLQKRSATNWRESRPPTCPTRGRLVPDYGDSPERMPSTGPFAKIAPFATSSCSVSLL